MTAIQYLSAFRSYGADVLLLALGVTFLTSLLKKTVLKSFPKKICVFLPFALGLVFYACCRMIVTQSVCPLTEDFASTVEGGFAVGCAATLFYVVYEQFIRNRGKDQPPTTALSPLLDGVIPEECAQQAETELMALSAADGDLFASVRETLSRYNPELESTELDLHAKLIAEFLSALPRA